ncbi:hypothetical protein PIB30_024199 [Stylosanthes scabra]|uniref:Uncharacterized protein n=1 Tax=Stylosanthes scabra TaxID=79078 RepID=A0ABU6Q9P2_9FABA|nr:hypothetical protein [Stylosanthes scabra]
MNITAAKPSSDIRIDGGEAQRGRIQTSHRQRHDEEATKSQGQGKGKDSGDVKAKIGAARDATTLTRTETAVTGEDERRWLGPYRFSLPQNSSAMVGAFEVLPSTDNVVDGGTGHWGPWVQLRRYAFDGGTAGGNGDDGGVVCVIRRRWLEEGVTDRGGRGREEGLDGGVGGGVVGVDEDEKRRLGLLSK